MADGGYAERSFNFAESIDGDSTFGDSSSGIEMKSEGTNSINLDSEARSVRSWESESERSWEYEEESEDEDDALGELDAWMNDEVYVPKKKEQEEKVTEPTGINGIPGRNPSWQLSGQISDRLAEEFKQIMKVESSRERARKASREIIKERNDTSGGGKRTMLREHIIIKWMLRVTHLNKDFSIDYADWIQDGTVLTLVMTTLDFNSVERDKYKQKGTDAAKERIENVIKSILAYGVHPKYVFKVDDVLHKKNTPKVVRCLEEVAKISRQETHIVYDILRKDLLYT